MTHVLLVEDSQVQADALRGELETAGFVVSTATNGVQALAKLDAQDVDVVLSDVVMPEMGGYELCRHLSQSSRHRGVPVVLLATSVRPLDVVAALEAGADNFIRKPPDRGQLVDRLRAAVENRKRRETSRARIGVQIGFLGRSIDVAADRHGILDLLFSTFEELIEDARAMQAREGQLEEARSDLQRRVEELEATNRRLTAVAGGVGRAGAVPLAPHGGTASSADEESGGADDGGSGVTRGT